MAALNHGPFHRELPYVAVRSEDPRPQQHRARATQVKRLLNQTGLNMLDVSAQTRIRFGEKSPYFIPQTFLYKQKIGITPHICQVAALSDVTGYRFADLMSLWGFDFKLVPTLQMKIPNARTTMVTPCDHLPVKDLYRTQLKSIAGRDYGRYLYAKIGSRDAVLDPEIRPGSIVRADRLYPSQLLSNSSGNGNLWLVQHPAGLTCCRVRPVGDGQVILLPNRSPLSPWPLRLSSQAQVLGLVDRELHCVEGEMFKAMHGESKPERAMSSYVNRTMTFSRLLRTSRRRIGLTFREANTLTLQIASILQDRNFGIAAGLLSDYEAMNRIPRHIAKVISLCAIYGIHLWDLLEVAGLHIDDSNRQPISQMRDFDRACA